MKTTIILTSIFLSIILLSACSQKTDSSEAAKPVEAFYNAIVHKIGIESVQ